MKVLYIDLH